jgi:hypothetical protein
MLRITRWTRVVSPNRGNADKGADVSAGKDTLGSLSIEELEGGRRPGTIRSLLSVALP